MSPVCIDELNIADINELSAARLRIVKVFQFLSRVFEKSEMLKLKFVDAS